MVYHFHTFYLVDTATEIIPCVTLNFTAFQATATKIHQCGYLGDLSFIPLAHENKCTWKLNKNTPPTPSPTNFRSLFKRLKYLFHIKHGNSTKRTWNPQIMDTSGGSRNSSEEVPINMKCNWPSSHKRFECCFTITCQGVKLGSAREIIYRE